MCYTAEVVKADDFLIVSKLKVCVYIAIWSSGFLLDHRQSIYSKVHLNDFTRDWIMVCVRKSANVDGKLFTCTIISW